MFDGDELLPAVRLKRARRAVKLDPEAAKPHYELGKALLADGQTTEAERALLHATELDPHAVWAWFDLGRLQLDRGALAQAEQAFARASSADPEYEHAGYFAAWAARAALARGDAAAAERHRARAQALEPGLVARQLAAAEHELAEGAAEEALALAELALAVAPRDMQALDLKRRAGRAR